MPTAGSSSHSPRTPGDKGVQQAGSLPGKPRVSPEGSPAPGGCPPVAPQRPPSPRPIAATRPRSSAIWFASQRSPNSDPRALCTLFSGLAWSSLSTRSASGCAIGGQARAPRTASQQCRTGSLLLYMNTRCPGCPRIWPAQICGGKARSQCGRGRVPVARMAKPMVRPFGGPVDSEPGETAAAQHSMTHTMISLD